MNNHIMKVATVYLRRRGGLQHGLVSNLRLGFDTDPLFLLSCTHVDMKFDLCIYTHC